MTDEIRPWDRQPNETPKEYEKWLVYRGLPLRDRSLTEAANVLKIRPQTVHQVAEKWNWHNRILAWDRYQSDLEIEAEQAQRKKIIEERLAVSQRFKAITARHINYWLREIEAAEAAGKPLPFPPRDVTQLYAIAAKIDETYLESTGPAKRLDVRILTAKDLTDDELASIAAGRGD